MRMTVTFRHPADFVPLSDQERILAVGGAHWFVALLSRVSGLQIDQDLCQEDWGVVIFARRNEKKFWVGLSGWDPENAWLAHFHHGSFAWLQRFSSSGKSELKQLLSDVHAVLAGEPAISDIIWYEENEMNKACPTGFPTPVES
jgi:hypothetical protein